MQNVINWIKEFAVTELIPGTGDEVKNQRADVMAAYNVPQWAEAQLGESGVDRLTALTTLGARWKSLGEGEFVETMTRAHFATYFADALSRAFYADYQYDGGSWKDYTYPDTTPDFRDVSRLRMSEPGTLYKRRDKQQMAATHIAATEITYGVEEYARQFDVSWQALMNDDLGKIAETPRRMVAV